MSFRFSVNVECCVLDALFEHCCQVQHCGSFRIPKTEWRRMMFLVNPVIYFLGQLRELILIILGPVFQERGEGRGSSLQFGILCSKVFARIYFQVKNVYRSKT